MIEGYGRRGLDQVMTMIEKERVRFVNLEFTDVVGMAKCVTIPAEQFADCASHGKWFDGSSIEGFARIAESDMYLFPDLSTFAILPDKVYPTQNSILRSAEVPTSSDIIAQVICDVRTPDGERFDGDPRAVLTRALDMARAMGYKFLVAPELEFFPYILRITFQRRCQMIMVATSTSPPIPAPFCAARWPRRCKKWVSPLRPAIMRWPRDSTRWILK
jgi:glutamine synthetase